MYLLSSDFRAIASFVDWLGDSTAELCICFSTVHIVGSFYLNFLRSVIGTISFELDGTFDPLLTFTQIRRSIIPAPGKSFIIADYCDSDVGNTLSF